MPLYPSQTLQCVCQKGDPDLNNIDHCCDDHSKRSAISTIFWRGVEEGRWGGWGIFVHCFHVLRISRDDQYDYLSPGHRIYIISISIAPSMSTSFIFQIHFLSSLQSHYMLLSLPLSHRSQRPLKPVSSTRWERSDSNTNPIIDHQPSRTILTTYNEFILYQAVESQNGTNILPDNILINDNRHGYFAVHRRTETSVDGRICLC